MQYGDGKFGRGADEATDTDNCSRKDYTVYS